jgi:hypothetical protein
LVDDERPKRDDPVETAPPKSRPRLMDVYASLLLSSGTPMNRTAD